MIQAFLMTLVLPMASPGFLHSYDSCGSYGFLRCLTIQMTLMILMTLMIFAILDPSGDLYDSQCPYDSYEARGSMCRVGVERE